MVNKILQALCLSVLVSVFAVSPAIAQDGGSDQTAKKDNPDNNEKKYDNYLRMIHAKEMAGKLVIINKAELARLRVIVANFGEGSDKDTYTKLANNYKQGMKDLYKKKYLESEEEFLQNRVDINEFLNKLAERYRDKAREILNRCADTLVERELGVNPQNDVNPTEQGKVFKLIMRNKIKLAVGYDNLNIGEDFYEQRRFSNSISHFRLAKLHGIDMLIQLANTEQEKDDVKKEYQVDLADGENKVESSSGK
jgi:hypothetical protein